MLKSCYQNERLEAGCDEAGRGCLAGPVFAAAVILPPDYAHPLLNDSKLLREKDREFLRKAIERDALSWSVAYCAVPEIDKINILRASFKAMHDAIGRLLIKPGLLLIDGHLFDPHASIPHKCIVRGDSTYASIAAASILAKTYRDDYMKALHRKFPGYGWDSNKGYPTKQHREGIRANGPTPHHRRSFRLLPEQYTLFSQA